MKPVRSIFGLSLLGSMLLSVAGCDQPRPKCTIAPGFFAATYRLLSSSGDCGAGLTGEVLGVQIYYSPLSDKDQSPNYRRAMMAIQPQQLTDLMAESEGRASANPDDRPYAFGEFTTAEPGDDDTCRVLMPSIARLRTPSAPAGEDMCGPIPELPEVDVSYTFNDVRVLVTPAATGTRFEANLTYQTSSCWATYRVSAVYPAVPCGVVMAPDGGVDDAATPMPSAGDAGMSGMDAGTESDDCPTPEPTPDEVPDDTLCGAGSGITPEFAVTCDPAMLVCVLAEKQSASP